MKNMLLMIVTGLTLSAYLYFDTKSGPRMSVQLVKNEIATNDNVEISSLNDDAPFASFSPVLTSISNEPSVEIFPLDDHRAELAGHSAAQADPLISSPLPTAGQGNILPAEIALTPHSDSSIKGL